MKKRRSEASLGAADGTTPSKPSLRERMCRNMGLSPDLLPGGTLLELRDRHLLTLRGGGKILLYSPTEVRIALPHGCLCIFGERLLCTSYYLGAVSVEGTICQVSFEMERGEGS
ncbi:MAG: YabP/YqfC family sporulation protein [Clostridia bacterium]|nr:YabP/YqfC family sporulation protein [Clostridia bacterium]